MVFGTRFTPFRFPFVLSYNRRKRTTSYVLTSRNGRATALDAIQRKPSNTRRLGKCHPASGASESLLLFYRFFRRREKMRKAVRMAARKMQPRAGKNRETHGGWTNTARHDEPSRFPGVPRSGLPRWHVSQANRSSANGQSRAARGE